MSAGRIVLWRHGRTEYNLAGRLQGQVDIPLDEVGRWQAQEAARVLGERIEPAMIVTSDLTRAADTAARLGEVSGRDVVPDERMRERHFGEWEGMSGDEVKDRWPDEYKVWRAGGDPVREGGETRSEVATRMLDGLDEYVNLLEESDTLVIVTHGAAISIAVTALLGLDPEIWKGISGVDNAHWTVLEASRPGAEPAWRLIGHNIGPGYDPDHWRGGPDWNLEPSSA